MENSVKIYARCYDGRSDDEAPMRGYRSDLYVAKGDDFFDIMIYDIVRLSQDFESEMQTSGYFDIEPNIILVKEVTRTHIIQTIERLNGGKYFEHIKPVKLSAEEIDGLTEWGCIEL